MSDNKRFLLTGIILLIVFVIMAMTLFSCRVSVPKQKGYRLTLNGFVDKDMMTKTEKKKNRKWIKEEKNNIKIIY